MRRREFVGGLLGAAAWPVAARAQKSTLPVIGFLSGRSAAGSVAALAAFHRGLGEGGYVEGRNVLVEYRWAEGRYHELAALAADLASRHVDVIATAGGNVASISGKAATSTIPIVFANGGDPIKLGLVKSLNQPDANATGVTFLIAELGGKRLALLQEMMPRASQI